jgi:hypothetical protein
MTLSSEQALYNRILDFVSSETTTRSQNLSGSTDIAKELGVEGDDAVEFMIKFQKEFGVDLSNFHFDQYFGGEGFNLIPFIKSLLGKGENAGSANGYRSFRRRQSPSLAGECRRVKSVWKF